MSTTTTLAHPITRRTFAKLMGALGAAASLGVGATKYFLEAQEARASVVFRDSVGICRMCGSQCGLIGRVSNGQFETFGNPAHPCSNQLGDGTGGLCVKGLGSPLKALSPDRVLFPMRRTNPRKGPNEDPGFVRISFAEAYELCAKSLVETIEQYGPKAVMVLSRRNDWVNRLRDALGTPNHMSHQSTCFTTFTWAWPALVPQIARGGRTWTHDYAHCTYMLSFGHDQVGRAQNPTVSGVIRAFENGAKAAVFDPRLSNMAAKALAYGGRYYEINPGTDLAVMWAIIKWIVANQKWNVHFIDNYVNATDWTDFRAFVDTNGFAAGELMSTASVADVAAWAEAKSGVPAADILQVALEFTNDGDYTNHRPHVMSHKRDGGAGPNYENSWRQAYATVVLDVLVGSIDRRGGNLLDRQLPSWTGVNTAFPLPAGGFPAHEVDPATGQAFPRGDFRQWWPGTSPDHGSFETGFDQMDKDHPYPIRWVFNHHYNTPFISCDTNLTVRALEKCFMVNHCYYADAGAWMSDVLLPDPSYNERDFLVRSGGTQAMSGYGYVAFQERSIMTAIGQSVSLAGAIREIGVAADATVVGRNTYQQACQAYADARAVANPAWATANPNFMTNRNSLRMFFTTNGTPTGTAWSGGALNNRRLADLAVHAPSLALGWDPAVNSMTTFASRAGIAGDRTGIRPTPATAPVWVDYSALSTASRVRLDVRARAHAGITSAYATVPDANGAATLIERFPGWAPPRVGTGAITLPNPALGEFWLLTNREPMLIHTEGKADELMVELSDKGRIEIHPTSASALGLVQGDEVIITTPQIPGARERGVIRVTEHIRQDCILIPHGWGTWALSHSRALDSLGNQTQRAFGLNASAGVGANDNTLVTALPLPIQVARRDPSASALMTDVKVRIARA